MDGDWLIDHLCDFRRFDIKWTAPKAEGSLMDARGDMIISHDYITVNSSSVAFELYTKVLTSYPDKYWFDQSDYDAKVTLPVIVEGVELDLRMRGFEFLSSVSSFPFDSVRPMHLKATGRIKFQGKVVNTEQVLHFEENFGPAEGRDHAHTLSGDVSISGLKLNQLMVAPQLAGVLSISHLGMKVCFTDYLKKFCFLQCLIFSSPVSLIFSHYIYIAFFL